MREETGVIVRMRRIVAPPYFKGDEEKNRVAALINATLWTMMVVVLCALPLLWLTAGPERGLPIIGIFVLIVVGMLFLLHKGQVTAAGVLYALFLFLVSTYVIGVSGGISTPAVGSYFAVMIIAGVLIGGQAAYVFAVLSLVAGVIMQSMASSGTLPSASLVTDPIDVFIWLSAHGLLGAMVLYLSQRGLRDALDRARRDELRLADSNQELVESQVKLQRRAERLQTTVETYSDYLAGVASGNLTARLSFNGDSARSDPLIVLGQRMNETVAALHKMTVQVRDVVNELGSTATEIMASTSQQLSSASQQSAAISQTTTTVDEVRTIAEQTVLRAQEVAESAQRSLEQSRSGDGAVRSTIASMDGIKVKVEGIAENILGLAEQTQQIGEIIATVNDIASQSNMLALNASVEAARAGEQGKGFAVVAMEVRSLAEQSKQATNQVEAILSDIQKATNLTVMATEEGSKGVEEGVTLSARTGAVIHELGDVIAESARAATQMVAGGQQQTSGIEQIALAMQNINQATVQSLASTRQAEKAAQDLNHLAQHLAEAVEQYQL
jgi:methyl-accepting chemotaxis protein